MKILFYFFLISFWAACNLRDNSDGQHTNKRLYIYSTSNNCIDIDWYCYSDIGSFANSKIEFRKKGVSDIVTLEGYYVSDIEISKDTLKIQLWRNNISGMNISKIPCFKIIQIDTTGDQNKNDIEARMARIIKAKIDYTKPHHFDSRAKQ
jgi:hypothetical protein